MSAQSKSIGKEQPSPTPEVEEKETPQEVTSTTGSDDHNSEQDEDEPVPSLCDSWLVTIPGGYMEYEGTFYEVRRVPNTLSDRLMSQADFGILPRTTAPGLLINGDKVEKMNAKQTEARKKELIPSGEVFETADGKWVDQQGLDDTQLAIQSDLFLSLPIIKVDPIIHHAKVPRCLDEIKHLFAVQGVPYLVQLVGRTEEGRMVSLKFGQDLTSWILGPFVDGAKVQLPEEWKYQWVVDIVLGLRNLHKRNILHADLTTNNVLFDKDHAILCDLESGPHTDHLVPPELAQGIVKDFNAKMDIYGLGTLLWCIENRNMPRAHRKLECTGVFADLMSRCMADDPDLRPTLDQIIEELRKLPETKSLFPNEPSTTNPDKCAASSSIQGTVSDQALIPDPNSWSYTHTGAVPLRNQDGTVDTRIDVEASQLASESDILTSLPVIEVDPKIHHVKSPRSVNELKNLISIQGISYLVQLLGRTTDGKIVTMKHGDHTLFDWINEIGKKISKEWKYQWVVDIALGLLNLHQKNIVHNDLADQNILLKDDHAIICDLESEPTTLDILPPEYAQDSCAIKEKSADIYALGVLLWSIENKNSARPHRALECTGIFKDIMSRCLATDPNDRPTIDQVVYKLWRLPQTRALFPVGYEAREANLPNDHPADVDNGHQVNTDAGDEEKTVYQIDGPQRLPWLNWLYNDKGAVISYNGIFYEIIRIPDTFSDRVINQRADLPFVPWQSARIIGDRIEKMTETELAISRSGCQVNKEGELVPIHDGSFEAERDQEVQLTIESDIFNSLPLIEYDERLHHAKSPRTIQEVQNLISARGVPGLVQVMGRTQDNQLATKEFGKSLSNWITDRSMETSQQTKVQWAVDIARALCQLHQRDMLHKDLSANNVLIDGDLAILCDLESRWTTGCARPPENCQGAEYDKRADVYGFGTLLWSIENRNMPRPHASLQTSGVFKGIMRKCLDNDPARRPTIDKVLAELEKLKYNS
ncbi:uncharacterized protein L199_003597 [Kwoniella botswanensis]|uniref:uncharacterized protein n=1 Tax=Kwoniella botswanensis TaxID=1268659 RepID=UPI00315CD530